jgi:hypothetical protein
MPPWSCTIKPTLYHSQGRPIETAHMTFHGATNTKNPQTAPMVASSSYQKGLNIQKMLWRLSQDPSGLVARSSLKRYYQVDHGRFCSSWLRAYKHRHHSDSSSTLLKDPVVLPSKGTQKLHMRWAPDARAVLNTRSCSFMFCAWKKDDYDRHMGLQQLNKKDYMSAMLQIISMDCRKRCDLSGLDLSSSDRW